MARRKPRANARPFSRDERARSEARRAAAKSAQAASPTGARVGHGGFLVRPELEFQTAHIAGASNMPLYTVKAQRFLRDRNVLLMASGIDDDRLQDEVPRLKQAGFRRIGILRRGLRWWQQQGGPINGDTSRLGIVTAQSLWAAQGGMRWFFVNVSADQTPVPPSNLLNARRVPFSGDAKAFEDQPRGLGIDESAYAALLLYDDSSRDLRSLESWAAQTHLLPVFILEGGMPAYSRYCLFQIQLHQRTTQTLARFDPLEFVRTFRATPRGTGCCGTKR
jgi:rhodanese-related sulfurtransferase